MTLVVSIGGAIIGGLGTVATAAGATSIGAALGSTAAAATAGGLTGASIGAGILGGATLGSGLGAVKSAIAGEDVGQGALMGAATGAVGGGLAPGVGAAGAAAGEAGTVGNIAAQTAAGAGAGALANTTGAMVGGKPVGTAALVGGLTGGALAGVNAAGAAPSTGADISLDQPGALDALGSGIANMSGSQALTNVGILGTGAMAENALNQKPEQAANVNPKLAAGLPAAMAPTDIYKQGPISGIGSIGMARGGQVPVRDGAYIIPADVVSALGNGSSKAGAEFLRRLMEEVKHNAVSRHGLGAARRAAA